MNVGYAYFSDKLTSVMSIIGFGVEITDSKHSINDDWYEYTRRKEYDGDMKGYNTIIIDTALNKIKGSLSRCLTMQMLE